MGALHIREIGEDRKSALEEEARLRGVSVAELVRQLLDDGLSRSRAERARQAWRDAAAEGLAYEAEALRRGGPSLAAYRHGRAAPRTS